MGRTNPLLFFNMTWTQTKWNVQQWAKQETSWSRLAYSSTLKMEVTYFCKTSVACISIVTRKCLLSHA
jgi:hypothetical protein